MADKKPSIAAVDDHPAILNAIRRTLLRNWRVSCFTKASELRKHLVSMQIHAVILDLGIPGEDGVSMVAEFSEQTSVLVFSANDSDTMVARVAAAGARGFLGKSRHEQELLEALTVIQAGGKYFPDEYSVATACLPEAISLLTATERRVLLMIGEGLQSKAIAEKLERSPRTVDGHRASIAKKLGTAACDLVAVAIAIRHGTWK